MLFVVIKSSPALTNIGKQLFEKAEKQKYPILKTIFVHSEMFCPSRPMKNQESKP